MKTWGWKGCARISVVENIKPWVGCSAAPKTKERVNKKSRFPPPGRANQSSPCIITGMCVPLGGRRELVQCRVMNLSTAEIFTIPHQGHG